MFAKIHLLSQDMPESGAGLRWRAHPYLRMAGAVPKGPAVFEWSARQRADLEALWRDPSAEGARERLAADLAALCDKLGWAPDAKLLEDAERHGDEYLLTLSAVPSELYLLPWEVIQVGAAGTYLSDHASAQVRYAVPGLEPRAISGAPAAPGVLFAWSAAGGAVPHEEQGAAIRAAAEAGGVPFRELAEVDEAKLQAALDAGPLSVLHLLCHGMPGPDGEPPRIKWGASDSPSEVTATRLARMLRPHSGAIRMVVLSACGSGDGHADPLFVSSLAQELHKKGIPNVIASRYPLSVRGSRVMTRALYDKLLREAWSMERALRHTRQALFRVDEDGESHPGDAYGIQLYAYDTERFVSDNNIEAERPILASYPFGTAAQPVPKSGPPAAELTLQLEEAPALDDAALAGELRRLSEDETLTVEVAGEPDDRDRRRALIVRTTVDGAQRLLGVWRSKALQTAVGVIVGGLTLIKGIAPALAAAPAAAGAAKTVGGQAAKAVQAAGQQAAGNAATAATTGQAATAVAGKTIAAVAGKAVAAKIAVAAVVGGVVVGGGAVVYQTTRSADPSPAVASASLAPLVSPTATQPSTAPPAPPTEALAAPTDAPAAPPALAPTPDAAGSARSAPATPSTARIKPSHHWSGEGTLNDVVGGVTGAVTVGKVGFAAGPVGKAFQLDGTGWVGIPRAAAVTGQGDFSVEAWFQTTATTPSVIVQQRSESDFEGEWILLLSRDPAQPGAVCYWDYGGGGGLNMCTSNNYADGKPHHVVFIRKGTTGRLCVDGKQAATGTSSRVIDLKAIDLSIGGDRRDGGSFFHGLIDEVKIYPAALPDCTSSVNSSHAAAEPAPRPNGLSSAGEVRARADSSFPGRRRGRAPVAPPGLQHRRRPGHGQGV